MTDESARLAIVVQKLEAQSFFVDRSFARSAHELQDLYLSRSGRTQLEPDASETLENIQDYRARNQAFFDEMVSSARPFIVPQDFQEFQRLYGGLSFTMGENVHVEIYGCGLSVMEHYQALQDPELEGIVELSRIPYLPIGRLIMQDESKRKRLRRDFVLVLEGAAGAGQVYEMKVVGSQGVVGDLLDAGGLPAHATPLAVSFTAWLELMLETRGTLGHSLDVDPD